MRLSFKLFGLIAILFSASAQSEQITIFAAASLTNAISEISEEYQQQYNDKIITSFAASSVLARQIEKGAPVDIYISADQQWMDFLQEKQLIENKTRKTILGNTLVVVTFQGSNQTDFDITKNTDWISLLKKDRLAMGDPEHVPIGIYAKEALINLGTWGQVEDKLARTDNVRSTLLLVERQEVPLGVVFKSDSVVSDKVRIVATFPASSHKAVEYPLAIVKEHNTPAVMSFYNFLQGDKAKAIFNKYGFITQ